MNMNMNMTMNRTNGGISNTVEQLNMNTQETTMKNNAVFMNSTEARENCGRRCVEQMGIPERVFVQCLSQGTTSGVVAFAVIVVVVVVVVVVAAVVVVVAHVFEQRLTRLAYVLVRVSSAV